MSAGDLVVDGGNSLYKGRPAPGGQAGGTSGLGYMDAGVSGGIWGLSEGYCIMAGGEPEHFKTVEPALKTLAPPEGYLHTGPVGSGHFVKMIHNGIEYGMMQAYAEGFDIMRDGPYAEHHDFEAICKLWMQGSVVRSWLLELLGRSFADDPKLEAIRGYVDDSGRGALDGEPGGGNRHLCAGHGSFAHGPLPFPQGGNLLATRCWPLCATSSGDIRSRRPDRWTPV